MTLKAQPNFQRKCIFFGFSANILGKAKVKHRKSRITLSAYYRNVATDKNSADEDCPAHKIEKQ